MKTQAKCKICRRMGDKLFLKGEKCLSNKCAMIDRPFAPGQRAKKRRSSISEYGKELAEKQKMKRWYQLSESQFKKYIKEIYRDRAKIKSVSDALVSKIETRLDNIIFRLGWAKSRSHANQLATHGHFMVNRRKVDIPSMQLKVGDIITIREGSKNKDTLKDIIELAKKNPAPKWLSFDAAKMEVSMVRLPLAEDVQLPADITTVFEHYSR
ncbi:MAG: 30S ribosomal protein S4 [Candidatus Pacebacteria bacterium]|nr:30S ribosomal protein S4 [Candidatus Paceibacterota bacterium]